MRKISKILDRVLLQLPIISLPATFQPYREIFNYIVAVLASIASLALTSLIWPLVKESPSLLFVAAVMISSWNGGFGPGLLATILSMLAIDYFFLEPVYNINIDWHYLPTTAVFSLVSMMISSLT